MFRFHKSLDVLTLFHSPSNPASTKVLDLLHTASEHATASGLTRKAPTASFELDVVEPPTVPTPDQLRSILAYIGQSRVGEVVKGAKGESDAIKILKEGGTASEKLQRPLLVDWNNGRAVLGADEKAIRNLVQSLPKD